MKITKDMTFGQRLRAFRKDRDMTVARLSKKSHVGERTIWSYEYDECEPKFALAVALADALEVDVEYLIPEYWHIKKES